MTNQDDVVLQILRAEDLNEIIRVFNFAWTSPEATKAKWNRYYSEQMGNKRIVCIAKCQGKFIGYGSLLKYSEYPSFNSANIPEIHDVWIAEGYRGYGFGKKLIQYLEWMAQQEHYREVGIGVGLYKDYGRAQRLYIQLGYIPDGEGVTYQYQPTIPGEAYPLDDDLVIWLKKKLPRISKETN